ncbi:SMC-Scp complex subunit ScpB [bacterium]|nr:SMC-Scp complex subunit ScpB [bacterium]
MTTELALSRLIEACLFVSDSPLSDRRLAEVLSRPISEVRAGLAELRALYDDGGSALELVEIAEGWRIATRASLEPTLARIFGVRRLQRLSRAALEVLSIIAYRDRASDPATAQDVEQVRGVDSYAVIKGLMEQDYIRQAGRKEVPGSPLLYVTTPRFLEYFGLKDLKDLPDEMELDALFKESPQPVMEPSPEPSSASPADSTPAPPP